MNVKDIRDLPVRPGEIVSILRTILDQGAIQGYVDVQCRKCQGRIWVSAGNILAARVGEVIDHEALRAIAQGGEGTCLFVETSSVPPRRILSSSAAILLEMDFAARTGGAGQAAGNVQKPAGVSDAPVDSANTSAGVVATAAAEAEAARSPAPRRGFFRFVGQTTASRVITLLAALALVEAGAIVWAFHPARKRHWEAERQAVESQTAEKQVSFRKRMDEVIARGDQAMLAGDPARAVACYRDAQIMDPTDRRSATIMTLAKAALRDRASALEAAQRATLNRAHLEEVKGRVDRLIALGDAEAQGGRLEAALKYYEKALTMAPENRGIQSLIQRLRERVSAQADAAKAAGVRSSEAAEKARGKLTQGDAKRRDAALSEALSLYAEALLLVPDDPDIRRRIEAVSAELARRDAVGREAAEWTADVRVGASTVRSLDLGGGRMVDVLVTANGGVVRVGKLDAEGKGTKLLYDNREPRPTGSATFSLGGTGYSIEWAPRGGDSVPVYHIVVRKQP